MVAQQYSHKSKTVVAQLSRLSKVFFLAPIWKTHNSILFIKVNILNQKLAQLLILGLWKLHYHMSSDIKNGKGTNNNKNYEKTTIKIKVCKSHTESPQLSNRSCRYEAFLLLSTFCPSFLQPQPFSLHHSKLPWKHLSWEKYTQLGCKVPILELDGSYCSKNLPKL